MRDIVFIIMDASGVRRMTKRRPQLAMGEIAIKVRLYVSNKFFERDIPEAIISIPDEAVIQPEINIDLISEDVNEQPSELGAE